MWLQAPHSGVQVRNVAAQRAHVEVPLWVPGYLQHHGERRTLLPEVLMHALLGRAAAAAKIAAAGGRLTSPRNSFATQPRTH